jgi:acetyltransferase-like isoleucine patch superfamily enzyme
MPYDTSKLRACGEDVVIDELVRIRYPHLVEIGSHAAIDAFFHVSTAMELGSYIHVGPHVSVIGGKDAKLIMKDYTAIAAGCRIICTTDDFLGTGMTNPMIPAPFHSAVLHSTIVMEKHSVLGTNCVVFPQVHIGEGAFVGACSVVKHDLEPWTIYLGNPAVPQMRRRSSKILAFEAQLQACRDDLQSRESQS